MSIWLSFHKSTNLSKEKFGLLQSPKLDKISAIVFMSQSIALESCRASLKKTQNKGWDAALMMRLGKHFSLQSRWRYRTFCSAEIDSYRWHLSRLMTKPTKLVCAQRRLRSDWASAQSDQNLRCALNG